MYGDVVLGMKPKKKTDIDPFEEIMDKVKEAKGIKLDTELDVDDLMEIISFLHAYLCLNFRATAEPKPSTVTLSSKISSKPRGGLELSPISLHHFTGMLRSNSFRVMSRPSTWCRD